MTASTISYVLDGLAVRLREGLNQEGYGLQEAARRLRELAPGERDHDTHEKPPRTWMNPSRRYRASSSNSKMPDGTSISR